MQTANRLRLIVLIPVLVAVVGVVLVALKLAGRFNDIQEPPGQEYPPGPPPNAGKPGQPLRPVVMRLTKRGQTSAETNASIAGPPAKPPVTGSTEAEVPATDRAELSGVAVSQATPVVVGGARSVANLKTNGIVGMVFLRGTPPPEKEIPMDPACGALHPGRKPQTRFFVVGTNDSLADVFVVLEPMAGLGQWQPSAKPVEIRQRGCEYLPYVTAAQVGQVVRVFNDDPVMHIVHPTPNSDRSKDSNRSQHPQAPPLDFTFPSAEWFVRFKCDVHPWMFAYVSVVEHPFFAVTDTTGWFSLPEPPPGAYTLRFIHRKTQSTTVQIKVQAGRRIQVNATLGVTNQEKSEAVVTEE